MFNMLNTLPGRGKNSPMVCKFLSRMSSLPHSPFPAGEKPFYLLEGMDFKKSVFSAVGLRIAFFKCQPAFARTCSGKD